ncbi:hypothetical protein BANRA_00017 [Klebsiella pneumoniae]|nr:hypothetical protein BANRA_00017 [Klebsiella pneumoniae]
MVRKPVQFIPQTDHAADDDQRRLAICCARISSVKVPLTTLRHSGAVLDEWRRAYLQPCRER